MLVGFNEVFQPFGTSGSLGFLRQSRVQQKHFRVVRPGPFHGKAQERTKAILGDATVSIVKSISRNVDFEDVRCRNAVAQAQANQADRDVRSSRPNRIRKSIERLLRSFYRTEAFHSRSAGRPRGTNSHFCTRQVSSLNESNQKTIKQGGIDYET